MRKEGLIDLKLVFVDLQQYSRSYVVFKNDNA